MNDVNREEAQAALANATDKAGAVRRTDQQFRSILLVLVGIDLATAILVGLYPRGGSRFAGIALVTVFVGGLIGSLVLMWRIRAYSRRGVLKFTWSIAAFSIWNAAVIGVSSATGWWGPHRREAISRSA